MQLIVCSWFVCAAASCHICSIKYPAFIFFSFVLLSYLCHKFSVFFSTFLYDYVAVVCKGVIVDAKLKFFCQIVSLLSPLCLTVSCNSCSTDYHVVTQFKHIVSTFSSFRISTFDSEHAKCGEVFRHSSQLRYPQITLGLWNSWSSVNFLCLWFICRVAIWPTWIFVSGVVSFGNSDVPFTTLIELIDTNKTRY